jgi:hypothetical protein
MLGIIMGSFLLVRFEKVGRKESRLAKDYKQSKFFRPQK